MKMQTTKRNHEGVTADVKLQVVRFNDRLMVESQGYFKHYIPLKKEQFEKYTYQTQGSISRTRMNDLFSYACHTAKDLSQNDHYILLGDVVWDSKALTMRHDIPPIDCVWRSPYACVASAGNAPVSLVMDIAGGDKGLYDDIMQSLAPLLMANKPDGVIWWVGDNIGSIHILLEAIHQLFPCQISSISVKRLTSGRETRLLNESFGNVVKEVSDGQVCDTGVYKSIATHEDFTVHRYHGQDGLKIRGNLHHIFTSKHVPTFSRKSYSVQWRTHAIPFARYSTAKSSYKQQELTTKVLGQLIAEMCRYATRIKRQGYRYEWSTETSVAFSNLSTARISHR